MILKPKISLEVVGSASNKSSKIEIPAIQFLSKDVVVNKIGFDQDWR